MKTLTGEVECNHAICVEISFVELSGEYL